MTATLEPPRETEAGFQAAVVELAHLNGWQVFHPYDSRRSTAGWPDLVLLRPPQALFVELKTDRGRLTPAQILWLDQLQACGLEAHVWRPRDWTRLEIRLTRTRRP